MRPFVCGLISGWLWVCPLTFTNYNFYPVFLTLCLWNLVGTMQTTVFAQSHVSCGWWEEEPYWFWVTGSKVKVNFGTLSVKTCGTMQTTVFVQSHVSCGWWEEEPYWFWLIGSKVNFGTLSVKTCGQETGYIVARSLSNFICKLLMMRGGNLLILGHMVKCQVQLWPLRGDATLCVV